MGIEWGGEEVRKQKEKDAAELAFKTYNIYCGLYKTSLPNCPA